MRSRHASRCIVATLLLSALWPALALAQQPAGVVTNLQGQATLNRPVLAKPIPVKMKDDLFVQDRIDTRENSIVRVLLGGKAVVTVRELSSFSITEEPGLARVDLRSGTLAVGVARSLLKPGEAIEIRTPNAVAAVRGSVAVINTEVRDGTDTTKAAFLEGEGEVCTLKAVADPRQRQDPTVCKDLRSREVLAVLGGVLGQIGYLTDQQVRELWEVYSSGASRRTAVLPADEQISQAAALLGGTPVGGFPPPPPLPLPTVGNLCVNCPATTSSATSGGGGGGGQLQTVTFNAAGSTLREQLSYTENGMTFKSLWPNPDDDPHLHLGDNNGDGSPDLRNHAGCCSPPYQITLGGKPFTLVSMQALGGSGTTSTFTANTGASVTLDNSTSGTFFFPAGFASATSVLWNVSSGRLTIDDLMFIDPPAVFNLTGPLFRSTNEQLDRPFSNLIDLDGYVVSGGGSDPLIWFSGSTLTTNYGLARMANTAVTTRGSFLRLDDGSAVIQTGAPYPVVSMLGGSLAIGSGNPAANLFELMGRASALQSDRDPDPVTGGATGLVFGSDRPIQPGLGSAIFEASNGATVEAGGSAYKVDTALLEATAPLLNLMGGSKLTTSGNAIDLFASKVLVSGATNAMVNLDSSLMNVLSGHLANVAASRLNVAGDFLRMNGGSILNIWNGLLLNVLNGGIASMGTFINFTGTGNVINVTNAFTPNFFFTGVPVFVAPTIATVNGAPNPGASLGAIGVANISISGTPIVGLGTAGTINLRASGTTTFTPLPSGATSAPASLIGVQGTGGTVKIGP